MRDMWGKHEFCGFQLAVRAARPYSWLEIRWLVRSANESPPTAREQNAWQDGAFRFEHALQSRAYRLDRAEQTRSAHSSPRAQEYAQNARGHRGHDSSQALGQVISPTVSPRASIFESRSQTTRVGALERKNFFQSKSQWTFCAVGTLKKSTAPPKGGDKRMVLVKGS